MNATTLSGKTEEVVELMLERNIDIVGIFETRCSGEGTKMIHNAYRLIYKGMKDERKYGVAFIIAPVFAERVVNIHNVNERMLFVILKLIAGKVSLIQLHAPHQEGKESFYSELQDTLNRTEGMDKIILGDLNAHVGRNQNNIESVNCVFGIGDVNSDG